MKEQRNMLLDQADLLVKNVENENRSLEAEERTEFNRITDEVRSLDTEIKNEESRQLDGKKLDNTEETNTMENEKEIRGLDQFLRKQDGEEKRDLQVTADGAAVIPENVANTIVEKMEETSPVFAKARKFPSVNGTLKIAKENAQSAAGFVGEGANVVDLSINLGDVTLTQKRVGAAISLSNQLINDSAINIVDYATNLLARRTAKAVEKSILVGAGTAADEFAGVFTDAEIEAVNVEVAGTVNLDDLNTLYNGLHPEYLDNASFIMSRPFYNTVSKLKDTTGHYFVQNGVVNGRLTKTLFGAEVIVSDAIVSATEPVIFGSIEDAYGVMVKRGFAMQHVVADTTQALRGSQLLVLDGYMDGAIYNPQAIVKLAVGTLV